VINTYLIQQGKLDIHRSKVIGLCVESSCQYKSPVAFPDLIQAGLAVSKIGNTSVRYEVGIFKSESEIDTISAYGYFVHVFVDKENKKPVDIPPSIRCALEQIYHKETLAG